MDRPGSELSPRARQVLQVIYRLGEASAGDILDALPDIPSYSAVRSVLRALVRKGYVEHKEKGLRYVYFARVPKQKASMKALVNLLETYFASSPEKTMKALLDLSQKGKYKVDLDRIEQLIEEARGQGR